MSEQEFDQLRRAMVSNQLRTNKVTDAAVLAAMGATPRERFVGEGQAAVAYRDTSVPLGAGRALNPPIATGRLLDAAAPQQGEAVLVVGASTGYVAALLAGMGCVVTALEESADLFARAQVALAGTAGVTLVQGPLAAGWPAGAPYALIYVDGAVEHLPEAIIGQLAEGGRLAGSIVERGVSRLVLGRRSGGAFACNAFADVEAATLPGFAPAPAFTF
jgi:protein-L-isoaspartate(D-aspartate) O-methyltransferase